MEQWHTGGLREVEVFFLYNLVLLRPLNGELRCIYIVKGGGIEMTLFLYPETQYSHSVVFSAEEKVAQLKKEKAFCFHRKEQTLKSFVFPNGT